MVPSQGSDRRVRFGRRRWLLGLPVAALLCSLALVAPATSGAKAKVDVSVTASPTCTPLFLTVAWTPVAGQNFETGTLTDMQTGVSGDIGSFIVNAQQSSSFIGLGGLVPLQPGRHVIQATITIRDSIGNPLITGTGSSPLPCSSP